MTTVGRNRIPLLLLGLLLTAVGGFTLLRGGDVVGGGDEPLLTASQADFFDRNRTLLALAGALAALAVVVLALAWARSQLPRRHLVDRVPLATGPHVEAQIGAPALAGQLEDDLRAVSRDCAPVVHVDGVDPLHVVTEARGTVEDLPLLAAASSRFAGELRPLSPEAVVELTVELLPPRRVDRPRAPAHRPVA